MSLIKLTEEGGHYETHYIRMGKHKQALYQLHKTLHSIHPVQRGTSRGLGR